MIYRTWKKMRSVVVLMLIGMATQPMLAQAYFGQEPPGDVPQLFAPGLFSLAEAREDAPCFWPDGLRCFFQRFAEDLEDGTILEAQANDVGWTAPQASLLFPNGAFEPCLTPDGTRIIYAPFDLNARHGTLVLQMMELGPAGWGDPIPLFRGMFASADMDGTLYYTTVYRNRDHIAYRVQSDGVYGDEILLGSNVFAAQHEDAHPSIAPDGSYLIFDSETRVRSNSCWLFITFRNRDGSWGEPIHLGSLLGDLPAALARISPDGQYLFFKANGDVYWVSTSVLQSLR